MSNAQHTSNTSTNRRLLAGRIAGAAVAAGLFLGAPLVTTLAIAPGVADAKPGQIDFPNLDGLDIFDRCAKPANPYDCDHDGVSNIDEMKWGTDLIDPNSKPVFNFGGNWSGF